MILKKIELTAKDQFFIKTVQNKIYIDPKSKREYKFEAFIADPQGGPTLKILLREIACKDADCMYKLYMIDRLTLNQFDVRHINKEQYNLI